MDAVLNKYIVLTTLSETINKKFILLRQKDNNLIFLLKIYTNYNKYLYEKIQDIDQPNVPTIYDIYESNNELYIVEEFINALTLADIVFSNHLDEDESIAIINQLCDILDVFHTQDPPIIHRDITLSNILYKDKKIYLIDFDIARFYTSGKYKDTQLLGTKGYVAPEAYGYSQTNESSDVYSLGVVANLLLTGYFPNEYKYIGKYHNVVDSMLNIDPNNRPNIKCIKNLLENKKSHKKHNINLIHNKTLLGFVVYLLFILFAVNYDDCNQYEVLINKVLMITLYVTPYLVIKNKFHLKERIILKSNTNKIINNILISFRIFWLLFIQFTIFGALLSIVQNK